MPTNEFRAKKILMMYEGGMTLQEISDVMNFSRERARQLILDGIKYRISKEFNFIPSTSHERDQLDVAAREVMRDIYLTRKDLQKEQEKSEFLNKLKSRMNELPDSSNFPTLSSYARALGISKLDIYKYFPELAKKIIEKSKKRWSWHYNKCRACGTTATKHRSHGLCRNCYLKSDIFKEMVEASRLRNKEKWRARQRRYAKQYNKRLDIIEKKKEQRDQKEYGGNRQKALGRDGYRCQICFITQEDSIRKLGRELYVTHKNNTKDHGLNNLITFCKECHSKRMMKIMRERLAKKISNRDVGNK